MRFWLMMRLSVLALLFAVSPGLASEGTGGERNMFEKALDLGIWTLVVFLVLLFVLSKFAWKPMIEGLDKRERDIAAAVEEAKKARDEAAEFKRQIAAERQKAHDEARQIVEEARKATELLAVERRAREDAELAEKQERQRRELDIAKDQALKETFTKLAELASYISSRAIRREITANDHRALVDEALAEMSTAVAERQRTLGAGSKA